MAGRVGLAFGLGSILLLGGCGGAPKAASSVDSERETATSPGTASAARTVPLPPVERADAPRTAFFRARVASPRRLIDGALGALGASERERVSASELWADLGKATDWLELDAALELGAMLNPRPREEPLFFYSFGVRSPDAVLAKLERDGETPLAGKGGSYYFTHSSDACVLGRSLGRSAYRVACADDRGALEQLEAWALRGLPAEDLGEDAVVADLDVRPVVALYGKELRRLKGMVPLGAAALSTGEPKFDGAMKKTLVALADEVIDLSEDVSTVRFGVGEKAGTYEVGLTVEFRSRSSWLASRLSELGGRAAPPPTAFDGLPAEAVSAGYSHHLDDRALEPMRKVLADLALGFGQRKGLGKSAAHLEQAVRELVWSTPWSVSAIGPFVAAKRTDGTSTMRPSWTLFGVPEKSQRLRLGYDHLVTLTADKKVWSLAEFEEPLLRFERNPGKLPGFPSATLYRWSFTEALRKELEGRVEELPEEAKKNLTPGGLSFLFDAYGEGVLGVYEKEGVTWVATGRDVPAVAGGLKKLTDPREPKLARTPELATMRGRPSASESYLRLSGLLGSLAMFLPEEHQSWSSTADLPNGGSSPMFFRMELTSGRSFSMKAKAELPPAFVSEVTALLQRAAATFEAPSSSAPR